MGRKKVYQLKEHEKHVKGVPIGLISVAYKMVSKESYNFVTNNILIDSMNEKNLNYPFSKVQKIINKKCSKKIESIAVFDFSNLNDKFIIDLNFALNELFNDNIIN